MLKTCSEASSQLSSRGGCDGGVRWGDVGYVKEHGGGMHAANHPILRAPQFHPPLLDEQGSYTGIARGRGGESCEAEAGGMQESRLLSGCHVDVHRRASLVRSPIDQGPPAYPMEHLP